MRTAFVIILLAGGPTGGPDGLALTPPIGWNSWNKFGCDVSGLAPGGKALVRDLWKKTEAGAFTGRFEAKVAPHDVVMLRITPEP